MMNQHVHSGSDAGRIPRRGSIRCLLYWRPLRLKSLPLSEHTSRRSKDVFRKGWKSAPPKILLFTSLISKLFVLWSLGKSQPQPFQVECMYACSGLGIFLHSFLCFSQGCSSVSCRTQKLASSSLYLCSRCEDKPSKTRCVAIRNTFLPHL